MARRDTYTFRATFLEDTEEIDEGIYVTVVGDQGGEVVCRSWYSNGDSYIEI
jgi:hypothetical protein